MIAWSVPAATQSCCSGGVPLNANIGYASGESNSLQVGLTYNRNEIDLLYAGSERLNDDARERLVTTTSLRGAYTFLDRWTVEAMIPYVQQSRSIVTSSGAIDRQGSSGIGDPVLLLIADLITDGAQSLRVGLGAELPVGQTDARSTRGLFLIEDLQVGSGATDLVSLGQYSTTTSLSDLQFDASILMRLHGTNKNSRGGSQSYQFGNDFQFMSNLTKGFDVKDRAFSLSVGGRLRVVSRDKVNDFELNGTGGTFLFAQTTIAYQPSFRSSISARIEKSLYTNVDETQVATDFIISLSGAYKFQFTSNQSKIIEL